MISMDDVAAKASVSKSTVSRVLNGRTIVSPDAREKVLAACCELGYKLNPNIQELVLKSRKGFTRNVAFVMVEREFGDPAYAYMIDSIARVVNEAHYQLLLVKLRGDETNIYELPPILRDERIDGIILTGELNKNIIDTIKMLDSKCVVLGNYSERLLNGLGNIRQTTDNLIASMMKELIHSGKRRIGFAAEVPENYEVMSLFKTYEEVLKENGLRFDPAICYFGKKSNSGVFDIMLPVMEQPELPFDSLVCPDNRIAREISHLLFGQFGLRKPIDVTLATLRMNSYYALPVPTIFANIDMDGYVQTAMRHLVEQIENNEKPRTISMT